MNDGRRFRGIFGMAVTWGVALSAIATSTLAIGLTTGVVPTGIFGSREIVALALRGLAVGGVAGGLFAWLLSRREQHRSIETLPSKRAALWGTIAAGGGTALLVLVTAGPALPLGVIAAGVLVAGFGGGVFARSLLRIARRPDKQLTGSPEDASHLIR